MPRRRMNPGASLPSQRANSDHRGRTPAVRRRYERVGRIAERTCSSGLLDHQVAVVADRSWRTRLIVPRDADGNDAASFGEGLSFQSASSEAAAGFRAGTVRLGADEHLAVATDLPSGAGYLVLLTPKAAAIAQTNGVLASSPMVGVLTFVWTFAILGVSSYMLLARFHDESERDRSRAIAEMLRQRQELIRTRDAVAFGLAKLADSRDTDTGDHLERISVYSTMLAGVLRHDSRYGREVTPTFARVIGISSALHDIGKVGLEDQILRKPGPLTESERRQMQQHTLVGGECLREIERRLGGSNFLQMAREIAFSHHEWWDGTGYPHGLKGEDIPLAARIVAVADVYDALSSKRVYKEAYPHEKCVTAIHQLAGRQFDPGIVEAWLPIAARFAEVSQRYRATPSEPATQRGVSDPGNASDREGPDSLYETRQMVEPNVAESMISKEPAAAAGARSPQPMPKRRRTQA